MFLLDFRNMRQLRPWEEMKCFQGPVCNSGQSEDASVLTTHLSTNEMFQVLAPWPVLCRRNVLGNIKRPSFCMCLGSCRAVLLKSGVPWPDSGALNVVSIVPCWVAVRTLWPSQPGLKFQLGHQGTIRSWASS